MGVRDGARIIDRIDVSSNVYGSTILTAGVKRQ
jgi:hypothetical protein